jgi:hypothetical protein
VPYRAGAGVVWRCHRAVPRRQAADPQEAHSLLRHAVLEAADSLAALDVARWRPEVADALMALRRPSAVEVPDGMRPGAITLASLAARCRAIVELALVDDGGAVSTSESEQRRAALLPLDRAARRGLVAACSLPWTDSLPPR